MSEKNYIYEAMKELQDLDNKGEVYCKDCVYFKSLLKKPYGYYDKCLKKELAIKIKYPEREELSYSRCIDLNRDNNCFYFEKKTIAYLIIKNIRLCMSIILTKEMILFMLIGFSFSLIFLKIFGSGPKILEMEVSSSKSFSELMETINKVHQTLDENIKETEAKLEKEYSKELVEEIKGRHERR